MDGVDTEKARRKARRLVTIRLRAYFEQLKRQLSTDAEDLLRRVMERLQSKRQAHDKNSI